MIVSVLNTKGGVGKTTIALNLALSQALAGKKVWLVDSDHQATAQQAIAQRIEAGKEPSIAVAHYPDSKMLHAKVQHQSGHFDHVVIDGGGRDSKAMRIAMLLSDVVIIPFQPRSFDVWGVNDMTEIAREAFTVRDDLKVFAVLSCADSQGSDNAEAAESIAANNAPLVFLDTPIGRRKAIAEAAGGGLSIFETTGHAKAKAEMRALVDAVFAD